MRGGLHRSLLLCAGSAIISVSSISCGDSASERAKDPISGKLPGGVVAQVGATPVTGKTVARIAAAQQVDLRTARDHAVYDALLAAGARSGTVADTAEVRAAVRGILAGSLLREQWSEARRAPISDEELTTWSERRWIDVDRPEGFRTVQAVALAAANAEVELHDRAKRLAERWRQAAKPAMALAAREPAPERSERSLFRTDPRRGLDSAADAFADELGKIDAGGVETQLGVMPVVAADGRVIDRDSRPGSLFVTEFCQAAAALGARGDVSEIVRTVHGYHVIMLLERLPARQLSHDPLREELQTAIWQARADELRNTLLLRLRRDRGAHLMTNADALLEQASVER